MKKFKATLENQLNKINYDGELLDKYKSICERVDSVFGKEAVLGESLNESNLKAIFHKVLNTAQNDLDKLRDDKKASGMVLDVNDIE